MTTFLVYSSIYIFCGFTVMTLCWWHREDRLGICFLLWWLLLLFGLFFAIKQFFIPYCSNVIEKLNNFRDNHNPDENDPRWH